MRFLVDVCVDVRVREWLREQGHDANHLRDEGLQKLPNGPIFVKASEEARFIVSSVLNAQRLECASASSRSHSRQR
jgi:predicted nuclease of predicted toxin-antitoxin system